MNNQTINKYQKIKIGRFESDNQEYHALVIFWTPEMRQVTIWQQGIKIIDKIVSKERWERLRDYRGLVMIGIEEMEWPTT